MAEKFWPGRSPLGQRIRRSGEEPDLQVVGVAADAKVRSLGEEPRSFVYRPLAQDYGSFLTAVVPTSVEPERTARERSDRVGWQSRPGWVADRVGWHAIKSQSVPAGMWRRQVGEIDGVRQAAEH